MLQTAPRSRVAPLPALNPRRGVHPQTRLALLLMAPALVVVAAVFLYPAALTLTFSVAEVNLITFGVDHFVGLEHYQNVLSDPALRAVATRTVYFGGLVALLTLV